MKDGDASVILRNVSISDTGTYECEIITSNTRSGERVIREFKHSINLTVTDAAGGDKAVGDKEGGGKVEVRAAVFVSAGLLISIIIIIIIIIIIVVVVTAIVALINYRRHKSCWISSSRFVLANPDSECLRSVKLQQGLSSTVSLLARLKFTV
ncbi:unnamed protein product [Oreochromis niloticus]|nr:unnamed protein product [Mustela putorius furo]